MYLSRRDRIIPVAAPGALSSTFVFPCTQLALLKPNSCMKSLKLTGLFGKQELRTRGLNILFNFYCILPLSYTICFTNPKSHVQTATISHASHHTFINHNSAWQLGPIHKFATNCSSGRRKQKIKKKLEQLPSWKRRRHLHHHPDLRTASSRLQKKRGQQQKRHMNKVSFVEAKARLLLITSRRRGRD